MDLSNVDELDKYVLDYYGEVCRKVTGILGYNPVSIDCNGHTILYNVLIYLDTTTKKIIEIDNLYKSLCKDIEKLFQKNNLELKEDYWTIHPKSGIWCFLGTAINVYEGLEPILRGIDKLILSQRVQAVAAKHNAELNPNLFYPNTNCIEPNLYFFCGKIVTTETSNKELDEIFTKFFAEYNQLNLRINHLLKIAHYPRENQLHPAEYDNNSGRFYLFSTGVNPQTTDKEILEIIHSANLFESYVKQIVDDFNILTKYETNHRNIKYEIKYLYDNNVEIIFTETLFFFIWSTCIGRILENPYSYKLNLDADYNKIKSTIQEFKSDHLEDRYDYFFNRIFRRLKSK